MLIIGKFSLQASIEIANLVEELTAESSVESESAMESYESIAESDLAESIKRAVIPIQAAFRFVARKSAKRLTPPVQALRRSFFVPVSGWRRRARPPGLFGGSASEEHSQSRHP